MSIFRSTMMMDDDPPLVSVLNQDEEYIRLMRIYVDSSPGILCVEIEYTANLASCLSTSLIFANLCKGDSFVRGAHC